MSKAAQDADTTHPPPAASGGSPAVADGGGRAPVSGVSPVATGSSGSSSMSRAPSTNNTAPVSGSSGAGGMAAPAMMMSMSGAGATAGMNGAAGGGVGADDEILPPGSYPPLDASMIGMPMQIADGFHLAESPLWDPCEHHLIFADVSAPGGGVINTLDADNKVSTWMMGTGNTNGMSWDIDGNLVITQMAGHIARLDRKTMMVAAIDPMGTVLHTPDDVVVRSDGTIYFSDGDFCPVGNLLGYGTSLPVFTIKPNTNMLINSAMIRGPNGIELSPDEKVLYVNGYGDGNIYRFDVMPDGTIAKQMQPFATGLTDPDSMCLDAAGNLYVAVSTGVQVFRPDGTKVTLIRIVAPAGSCTKAGMSNCTFGGEDGKTLYITSWTTILKIDNMPIPGLDWFIAKRRVKCS
jgi:gluconolactonase